MRKSTGCAMQTQTVMSKLTNVANGYVGSKSSRAPENFSPQKTEANLRMESEVDTISIYDG